MFKKTKETDHAIRGGVISLPVTLSLWLVIGGIAWYCQSH